MSKRWRRGAIRALGTFLPYPHTYYQHIFL